MIRIHASAIVDELGFCRWSVTVTGLAPYSQTKKYEVRARTDNLAAQEGIRLFVEEMERLIN